MNLWFNPVGSEGDDSLGRGYVDGSQGQSERV